MWSRIQAEFPDNHKYFKLSEERSKSVWIRGKNLAMVTTFPTTFVLRDGVLLNGNPIRNYPGESFKKEFKRIIGG
jgi:hypothetical protein